MKTTLKEPVSFILAGFIGGWVFDCLKSVKRSFSSLNCNKIFSLRWPISATAKLTFPRQNLLFHGKTYFSTAKLTFPRQNLLSHGKTFFSMAKLTFSRQNLLFHGKTYFSTAKLHKGTGAGSVQF